MHNRVISTREEPLYVMMWLVVVHKADSHQGPDTDVGVLIAYFYASYSLKVIIISLFIRTDSIIFGISFDML